MTNAPRNASYVMRVRFCRLPVLCSQLLLNSRGVDEEDSRCCCKHEQSPDLRMGLRGNSSYYAFRLSF